MKSFTIAKSRKTAVRRRPDWFVLISFSRKALEPVSYRVYFVNDDPAPLKQLAEVRNYRQKSREYFVTCDTPKHIEACRQRVIQSRAERQKAIGA